MKLTYEQRRERRIASGQAAAHTIVARAIRHGELAPIRGKTCVDCGKPAVHYDHRDYGRPLEVVPVCRPCNYRRGPALRIAHDVLPTSRTC